MRLKTIIFWLAIGALFTPFFVSTQTYFPFIVAKATVFRAITELMLVVWVFFLVGEKKSWPKLTPLAKAVLIYGLIIFLSALMGVNFKWSFFSGNERMEGVFGIWHFIVFFIVLITTFDWREIEKIFKIQVFVSLFYSFLAAMAFGGVGLITSQMTSDRWAGYTGNPSFFAVYLLFNAFWALYFYFQQYGADKKLYNHWCLAFVFQSLLLFATGARGAMIGYLLALAGIVLAIIFGLKDKKFSLLRQIVFVLVLTGVVAVSAIFSLKQTALVKNNYALSRLTSISLKDPTVVSRLMSAQTAWNAFREKPVFGWGPENYQSAYVKYFNPLVIKYLPGDFFFDRAHNKPMEILATTGILGFVSYLGILGVALQSLFVVQKKNKEWLLSSVVLASMLIGYFIQNIFIFDFHESYLMFFLLLAFIASLYCHPRDNGSLRDSRLRGNDNRVTGNDNKGAGNDNKGVGSDKDFSQALIKYFVIIAAICSALYSLNFWVIRPYLGSRQIFKVLKELSQGHADAAFKDSQKIFWHSAFLKEDAVISIVKGFVPNALKIDFVSRQKIANLLIDEATKILDKHPDRFLLLMSKATLEGISSEWDQDGLSKAKTTVQYAISLAPFFPQPRILYIKLLLIENKNEEAFEQTQNILALNPDIAEAQYYLAVIYQKQGKNAESLAALVRAGELGAKKNNQNLIIIITQQFFILGRHDLAENMYLQAIEAFPKDANLRMYLAIVYGKIHNKEKAIFYAQEAKKLNGNLAKSAEDLIEIVENEEWEKFSE